MSRECYCGNDISHKRIDAMFCSQKCKNASTMKTYRKRHGISPLIKEVIACKNCQVSFKRSINEQVFCSIKCKSQFHEKSLKELICGRCGDVFEGKKRRRVYCDICVKFLQSKRILENPKLSLGKPGVYKGITFRSQLEIRTAKRLDGLGFTDWTFEPCVFYFPIEKVGYIPDFYLKSHGVYLECKGTYWKSEKTDLKKNLVEQYTGKKVILVSEVDEHLLDKLLQSSALEQ